MLYEIVFLSSEWFFCSQGPDHFKVLTEIINKGYSKARDRFDIVASPRIECPSELLNSFHVKEDGDFVYALLLGNKQIWSEIETQTGYRRRFNADISPKSHCEDSDVPPKILEYFGELEPQNVTYTFLKPNEHIDEEVQNRVFAVAGYQILEQHLVDQTIEIPGAKYYELTGFCAFGKRMGTKYLEYTIEQFFADRSSPIAIDKRAPQFFVCCVVIAEHDLVPYYTKVCKFTRSKKEDVLVTSAENLQVLESTLKFKKDFHVSFLYREVIPS
ncbi:hypothetical protein PUMCH_003291 [Australozyma saopauloensis]|uniref:Uncharacterized protein n=1 Tax=Australozyma saopauloensis TaxID=291208 RepID=A0AAX4HBM6_9ASCO|nr:hypothetical protein PUMCH_003291 [[Candida] saopauloensis]